MIEVPQSFVVREECETAAFQKGFRRILRHGIACPLRPSMELTRLPQICPPPSWSAIEREHLTQNPRS